MGSRLLGGWLVASAACAAAAQSQPIDRWPGTGGPLGLQASRQGPLATCGTFSLSCDATALPLYATPPTWRSLNLQVMGYSEAPAPLASRVSPGLNVGLVGKAGLGWDLGVYGRVGTSLGRPLAALAPTMPTETGLSYGLGLNWDFASSASAAIGVDRYELRGSAGDFREVRTSLGLRWRY